MKAHKFVAEFGIDVAKEVLEGAPEWAIFWITQGEYHISMLSFPNMVGHHSFLISDLKRLVESVDLIKKHGGLFSTKCQLDKGGSHYEWYGENGDYGLTDLEDLEQAIADYEAIGGEHV